MTIITIYMRKNDGLEKKKKIFLFCIFTSRRFCLIPGSAGVGPHFRRLPDNLGGFTCMQVKSTPSGAVLARSIVCPGLSVVLLQEQFYLDLLFAQACL